MLDLTDVASDIVFFLYILSACRIRSIDVCLC